MRILFVTAALAGALVLPAGAAAQTPAPGPWPAPVPDATNPLLGTPFVANGSNAAATARVRVWLPVGRSQRTAITRRIGGRTVLRGSVANHAAGKRIAGATVLIVQETAGIPGWNVIARAQTARTGRFRTVLPPGLTRRVAAVYWPFVTDPAPLYSRRVLIRAGARVYLRAQPHARRMVRIRGRVTGAPIPPGGLLVAVQVANGPRWPTIRLIHTLPSGRFFTTYRFAQRRRYTIRATVPRQASWPLFSGRSATERLRTQ